MKWAIVLAGMVLVGCTLTVSGVKTDKEVLDGYVTKEELAQVMVENNRSIEQALNRLNQNINKKKE